MQGTKRKQDYCQHYLFTFLFIFVIGIKTLCNGKETELSELSDLDNVYVESPSTKDTLNVFRKGKDLIYEAMKMRTGIWPPQGKDLEKLVGGGLVEKQLLNSPVYSHARENPDIAIRFESRGECPKKYFGLSLYCV